MKELVQASLLGDSEVEKISHTNSYFDDLLHLLGVTDDLPAWSDCFGNALHTWTLRSLRNPIRMLSLFSGGGGLDIAFHDAHFTAVQMVEIEQQCVETLKINAQAGKIFEGTQTLCMDVRQFEPAVNSSIDFIIGGPPCQTFSAAGRRAAGVAGLDDPRGQLFQEYVRILCKVKPKGFLFENVYGIVGAQGGKAWREILDTFESVGYTISYRILDAADYGVPQHRERLIIVGLQGKYFAFPRPTHGPDSQDHRPYYTPALALQNMLDEKPKAVGGRYGYLLKGIPPGLNYSFYTEEMGHPTPHFSWRSKFSDLLYKADPDMPVRTIKAQGGQYTGPFHWENRPFSVGELKRLQTFPDNYTLTGGRLAAIQQIGNSVPPQMGRMLAIAVLEQVFGVHFPFALDYLSPQEELTFRQRKASLTTFYRKRAKEAISKLGNIDSVSRITNETPSSVLTRTDETSESFEAYLGMNMLWVANDGTQDYPWNIRYSVSTSTQAIALVINDMKSSSKDMPISLEVSPVREWILPISKVILTIQQSSLFLLTGAWKAFEYHVALHHMKADLVQLNGYYQYEPKIATHILNYEYVPTSQDAMHVWETLKYVLEGVGVRRIVSLEELTELWKLTFSEIIDAMLKLRALGYEIRSEFTNNQIPQGHILIPYAFPTLNSKSVHMRKILFPSEFEGKQHMLQNQKKPVNQELWSIL